MKVKRVKIGIRSTDEVLREAAETMKSVARGKKVRPKGRRLFFTSPEALRRFLTPKRLELIRLVRKRRPSSINELAGFARRDFKRVYEDIMSLSEAGLVELAKDNGRKKAPRVADQLRLEIVV
ncbi:MAG: transcriptional regulator [Candidatus Binatia bacterium]